MAAHYSGRYCAGNLPQVFWDEHGKTRELRGVFQGVPWKNRNRHVEVRGEVRAPIGQVFEILADIRNHRVLACRRIELLDVSEDGQGRMLGVIGLNGPCGVRRKIATREVVRQSPSLIWGAAAASSGSVAFVSWSLQELSEDRTRVSLMVLPVRLGRLDHGLLVLGGRRVLCGMLNETLQRLEGLLPAVDSPGKTWSLGAANSA